MLRAKRGEILSIQKCKCIFFPFLYFKKKISKYLISSALESRLPETINAIFKVTAKQLQACFSERINYFNQCFKLRTFSFKKLPSCQNFCLVFFIVFDHEMTAIIKTLITVQ